jgi:hypothetical protein
MEFCLVQTNTHKEKNSMDIVATPATVASTTTVSPLGIFIGGAALGAGAYAGWRLAQEAEVQGAKLVHLAKSKLKKDAPAPKVMPDAQAVAEAV